MSKNLTSLSAVWRLISILRGEWVDIGIVCIYAALVGICSLCVPIAVQAVVGSVAGASLLQPVVVLTAFVAGILVFAGVLRLLQFWVAEVIQRRLMLRCSLTLARQLPQVRTQEFGRFYGADFVVRFMEVFNVQKLATLIILDGSAIFFQIIVGLVLVSFYHPIFLAFALCLVIGIAFVVFILGIGGAKTSAAESEAKYAVMSWLQAMAHAPDVFKSNLGEAYAIARMDHLIDEYLAQRSAHFRILFRQNGAGFLVQAVVSALLLGVGSWLVIIGQLTLGQLVAAELVFGLVLTSLTKLGRHLEKFYDIAASTKKLDSLFELPYEEQSGITLEGESHAATLSLKSVSIFSPDFSRPLLEDVTFQLASGEKAVLWAPSASGKSSLANCIYRSMDVSAGAIEFDGQPIQSIHPRNLRSSIAFVRGVEIFPGTISDNLTFGSKDISPLEMRRALDAVGLWEKISMSKAGLDTLITSTVHPFSSGEALRLMVSRALLLKPRLMIIDGALDAMDSDSQSMVLKLINNELSDLTVLILTHELSLARSLPRRFKIENRTVIEQSTEEAV